MDTNQTTRNPLEEFLTPEAMLTPGMAGSVTMMITNALSVNFAMPRAWVGLVLSFIFGLLVLISARGYIAKFVYYIFNSLVIFCVAVGANGLGVSSARQVSITFTSRAFAQDIAKPDTPKQTLEYCADLSFAVQAAQKRNAPPDEILALVKPCQSGSKYILDNPSQIWGGPNSVFNKPTFFEPWRF